MKKLFLLLLISIFAITNVRSQTILSLSVSPTNPTPSDTIKIIAECVFPSGGCDGSANIVNVSGNVFSADAFHCLGILTVICTDYDTLVIPPQAAGQYSLIFTLSAGHGFPCTPGIVVDDIDTLNFNVEEITGINNLPANTNFQILPNPSDGKFTIKSNSEIQSQVKIYSAHGKLINSFSMESKTEIENLLPAGIYFIHIENENRNFVTKLVVGY